MSISMSMKAVVYERYGAPDVLEVKEVARPIPKDHEVLVEVRATAATSGDARLRAMNVPAGFGFVARLFFGVLSPRRRILGGQIAGVVTAIGRKVTRFAVGDHVFAMTGMRMGGYAEYCAIAEDGSIAKKPANVSFDDAAAMPFGGNTALDFFRRGKLRKGERLLVVGASGAVGTAAVQLAKHFGAHVTGVCSTANVELVRSLGADAVIDYTKEDFTRSGETYDVIMDTVGTAPYARSKGSLKAGGRLLLVVAGLPPLLAAPWINMVSDRKIVAGPVTERADDLRLLAELAEQGRYEAVIDRRYPLERTAEAHAYVDTGRKKGNVVVTVHFTSASSQREMGQTAAK